MGYLTPPLADALPAWWKRSGRNTGEGKVKRGCSDLARDGNNPVEIDDLRGKFKEK